MQGDDRHTPEEAKRRFEAALRGARLAESHPMKDFIGKGTRAPRMGRQVKKSAPTKPK
jgi:hypothetical protein